MRFRVLRVAALPIGLAILASANAALAQPPRGPGGPPPREPPPIHQVLERHAARLGIDAESQARISEIAETSRARQEAFQEELRALHERMRTLLDRETPDESAVVAGAEEIGRVENEAYKDRLLSMLRIRALLTPAQRAELVAIRQEERGRHERRVEAACAAEIETLCPDAEPGRPTFECLGEYRQQLSPECREAERPRRHRGSGPPR